MKTSILIAFCIAAITSSAQFKPGYYFTKEGVKVKGLLKFQYDKGGLLTDKSDGDCTVFFKLTKTAKRQKFTAKDICCFVIAKDSFAVIKNFELNPITRYPLDFAKVLEVGKINLYLYYSAVHPKGVTRTITDWFIEKDGKVDRLNRKNFKKMLPAYLSDYPALAIGIQNKSLKFRDAEKIIRAYDDHFISTRN
jgi:hypothetical protein